MSTSTLGLLIAISLTFQSNVIGTSAFLAPAVSRPISKPDSSTDDEHFRRPASPLSMATAADAAASKVTTKRVTTDEEIMDVASFRNDADGIITSPEMLVAKQQARRDSMDSKGEALKGVAIGLGIGAAAGVVSGISSHSVSEGLTNFGVIGGVTATLLGINNLSGKNVYVFTVDEAKNRLKVDFVEGLMARQDVGFVATTDDLDLYDGRYRGSNGVVACIDCQLRNSDGSANPRRYGSLPPHVHIRNLAVDAKMRRRGIARLLVEAVEDYARSTDAEMITLAVDDTNIAAINLYKKYDYDIESIESPAMKQKYGTFFRGRSMMSKQL